MGDGRGVYRVWWENLRKRYHFADPDVDGRIVLRLVFKKWAVGVCTGLSWLWIEIGGRHL
jgi:hypothetical protein